MEPASLKQLCKPALVPGEARDRLGLFVDALHPRQANKATHGIGTENMAFRKRILPLHSA